MALRETKPAHGTPPTRGYSRATGKAREDSNLQPSGYAPVVCHCPAAAESYWNLNKIGVRSFILSGAPIPSSTYRTSPFEETKLKRFFKRFSPDE